MSILKTVKEKLVEKSMKLMESERVQKILESDRAASVLDFGIKAATRLHATAENAKCFVIDGMNLVTREEFNELKKRLEKVEREKDAK